MTHIEKKLAQLEQDLAAFKREHAGHSHEIRPFALHTLAPTPDVHAPTPAQIGPSAQQVRCAHNTVSKLSGRCNNCNLFMGVHLPIADMRINAENRAWTVITEWITSAPKKPEHSGSTYEVRTSPVSPGHGTDWDAAIWRGYWNEAKDELDSEVVSTKRGTSRLDALAHLAAWCEEDMYGKDGQSGG